MLCLKHMILRTLGPKEERPPLSTPQAARTVFLNSQKDVTAPFAIILQADHARLAGDLAAGLHDDVFGRLEAEVIRATAEHDLGWEESDGRQIEAIAGQRPRPFPDIDAEESIQAGRNSIAKAGRVSTLLEVLISRHFTTLGSGDPTRESFVREETERREPIERELRIAPSDLERWTAALGFCDLLSLYLCCGRREPVEFPLAHPADPAAECARKVTLTWEDGSPRFSESILKAGAHFVLPSQVYSGDSNLQPARFEWTFVSKNPG